MSNSVTIESVANEILAILQNVEDEEDQSVFVRIYVDAIIRSAEFTGAKLDKYQIYKNYSPTYLYVRSGSFFSNGFALCRWDEKIKGNSVRKHRVRY